MHTMIYHLSVLVQISVSIIWFEGYTEDGFALL